MSKALSAPDVAALFAAQRSPFSRAEWFAGLEETCEFAPLIAVARADDVTTAILPLMHNGAGLAGLANWYSFSQRPLLSQKENGAALLTALARDLRKRTWRVALSQVPEDDACALASAFRKAGWVVSQQAHDINHYLEVGTRDAAAYLAERPGKLRTTLKRKAGKVECKVFRTFDEAAWAAYEAVYARSWKPEEGSPVFLERFAREEGRAGRLRLGVAWAEGEPVAAQLWTVEDGTAYIHKLAYVEEAKPLSPGSVLSAALFTEVIDVDKVHTVDFGTGDDPYKRDWMEAQRPRYRLEMLDPAAPRSWPRIAKSLLRHLARRTKHG